MQLVEDLALVSPIIEGTRYYTVIAPPETTMNHGVALGTHSREAQLIISRLPEEVDQTQEGFYVIMDDKRVCEYQGIRWGRRNRPMLTHAVFFGCPAEDYVANPLASERALYDFLQQAGPADPTDELINNMTVLKLNGAAAAGGPTHEFRLNRNALRTSRTGNGFLLLTGTEPSLMNQIVTANLRGDAHPEPHPDVARHLFTLPFASLLAGDLEATRIQARERINELLLAAGDEDFDTLDFTHHFDSVVTHAPRMRDDLIAKNGEAAMSGLHFMVAIHTNPWLPARTVEVDIPGGKRNVAEDTLLCALRETWEETNVRVLGFNPAITDAHLGERLATGTGNNITTTTEAFNDTPEHVLITALLDAESRINMTFMVYCPEGSSDDPAPAPAEG